jgi:hypothetical protein
MSQQFAPSFTAAKLYRKTSAKGGTYFTGRMGGVKVALLKTNEVADDGSELWSLVFSEAAPYQPKAASNGSSGPTGSNGGKRKRLDPQRPLDTADRPAGDDARQRQAATMNDPIPF